MRYSPPTQALIPHFACQVMTTICIQSIFHLHERAFFKSTLNTLGPALVVEVMVRDRCGFAEEHFEELTPTYFELASADSLRLRRTRQARPSPLLRTVRACR